LGAAAFGAIFTPVCVWAAWLLFFRKKEKKEERKERKERKGRKKIEGGRKRVRR
jgi:hypothetical protein